MVSPLFALVTLVTNAGAGSDEIYSVLLSELIDNIIEIVMEHSDSNSIPRWLVVGFSGHRNLEDQTEATAGALSKKLGELAEKYSNIAGICSAASGADTLFAEAMLDRKAPLCLVLPFGVERFKKDFGDQSDDSWARAQRIIAAVPRHCIDVVHQIDSDLAGLDVSAPGVDGPTGADGTAYYEATVRTVDRCDVLLAVWNGQPGQGSGGTADAVKYAKERGIPRIVYNPQTAEFSTDEIDKLPAPAKAPLAAGDAHPQEILKAQLTMYDEQADRYRQPAQSLMQWVVWLHLGASAVGAFAVVVVGDPHRLLVPALFELCVLLVTYVLLIIRGQHHHRWFTSRVNAEICRTFKSTWDIRRYPSLVHQRRNAIADHLSDERTHREPPILRLISWLLSWFKSNRMHPTMRPEELFKNLRILRELDTTPLPAFDSVRDTYLNYRLTGEKAQIKYFTDKLEIARRIYHRFKICGTVASAGAVVSVAVVVKLLHSEMHGWPTHLFEWLGIVLPLVATACTFLMVSSDSARRAHRYGQMIEVLARLELKIRHAPTWEALSRAATQTEEELLQEIVEWQSFVHYTEHLH